MGLDAYCGSVSGRLGSYGWFHSFRMTVARLEDGIWGYKFPNIQLHSDCEGEYSPDESVYLLKELRAVEDGFRKLDYPCALYLDACGDELGYAPKYSEDGTFMFAQRWKMGVDDEGLVFYPHSLKGDAAPIHFREIAKGGEWYDLWFDKPEATERIAYGSKPAGEVFAGTLELFIQLAEESIRIGEPIVFW